MEQITIAVVGAGIRGIEHARAMVRGGRARVVAVAEPDPLRRARLGDEHAVPEQGRYRSWEELAAAPRCARLAVVATQDALHAAPAVALAGRGYDLVVEKPLAPTETDSARIVDAARANGVLLAVPHVLRYTPYFRLVRRLLDEGRIGRLASVQHLEQIGHWHAAHSYVRGNWSRTAESGPLLLTKCCHDIDLLGHLVGRPVRRVASFGGRAVFGPENRPPGAARRCLDCVVEPDCPYSAPRLYLGCLGRPRREHWPLGAGTPHPTRASVLAALRTGPYGLCVYGETGSDVLDQQVVALEYDGGVIATHTVTAFTESTGHRRTRLFGSHGCLDGDGVSVWFTDFRTGRSESFEPDEVIDDDHDGGHQCFADAVVEAVAERDPGRIPTDAEETLASHRVVWAAERARITGTVVEMEPA